MGLLFSLGLLGLGLGLRLWALRSLQGAGMTSQQILSIERPARFIETGPYRFLQHPAYVGSLLVIAGGGGLALGPAGFVLALPAWPFFASRIHEENRLRCP